MAFRSNGPINLSLPAFRGVTRRLILIALVAFFIDLLLGMSLQQTEAFIANALMLHPDQALHGLLWQFVTYPFLGQGLLSVAFALISVWFFGSTLEDDRGSRWFSEFFLTATIGGGLLASLLAIAVGSHVPGLNVATYIRANGMYPFVLALVVAFAAFHAEEEINFNFIFKIKAKYLAAIYVLFYLGATLAGGDRFGTLTALCNALAGYAFIRFAARQGLRSSVSERWYGIRNAWLRAKRRRAAKKFTVYMKKQGKDVSLDSEGRYVDPSGKPRDPNDRNWMN
jgi:membrane associated rhomboid family serine protease